MGKEFTDFDKRDQKTRRSLLLTGAALLGVAAGAGNFSLPEIKKSYTPEELSNKIEALKQQILTDFGRTINLDGEPYRSEDDLTKLSQLEEMIVLLKKNNNELHKD